MFLHSNLDRLLTSTWLKQLKLADVEDSALEAVEGAAVAVAVAVVVVDVDVKDLVNGSSEMLSFDFTLHAFG